MTSIDDVLRVEDLNKQIAIARGMAGVLKMRLRQLPSAEREDVIALMRVHDAAAGVLEDERNGLVCADAWGADQAA